MGQTFTAWSEEELSTLRNLSGTMTASQVGKKIGRGVDGVRKMAKKLGLPSYNPPPAEKPIPKPRKRVERVEKKPHPIEPPVKIKTYTEPPAPLRQVPDPKWPKSTVAHSQLDYCPCCHSPVSNWDEHLLRMGRFGCTRPAA